MPSELSSPTVPPPGGSPRSAEAWRRILYMIGYSFIAYFVLIGIFLVAIGQAIHVLVTKRRLGELETLAHNMTRYLAEVVAFVAWVSDDKPFPAQSFTSDPAHSPKA
jgi:dolichyl-phosphate-mannose--protein O-mannosyl transferase